MNKEHALRKTRYYIINNNFSNLDDALKSTQDFISILSSLLFACGFSYVSILDNNNKVVFFAGAILNDLNAKFVFFKDTKTIAGRYKKTIDKVFILVNSIESNLPSSVLLPPTLRQVKIQSECDRIGIDPLFFRTVLENWTP